MSILSKCVKKTCNLLKDPQMVRHATCQPKPLSTFLLNNSVLGMVQLQSYTSTVPAKIWTSVKLCEVSPLWGATLANSSHQPPPFCLSSKKDKASKSSGSNAPTKPTTRPKWFRCLSNPIPLHPLLPHQGRHNLLSLKRRPSLTNLWRGVDGVIAPPTNQEKTYPPLFGKGDEQVLNPQTPKND